MNILTVPTAIHCCFSFFWQMNLLWVAKASAKHHECKCKIFKGEKRQQEGCEIKHHKVMNLTFLWGWGQIDEASAFLTCKGKETHHITAHTLLIYGKWTAFIQPFSNQWPIKALLQYCLTFTRSRTHSHTPTTEESATQGHSQLFWLLAQGTPLHSAWRSRGSN